MNHCKRAAAFVCVFCALVGARAADQYWSGAGATSDNIDQADNWFTAVPSSGDNLFFNNTSGFRHWPFSNYGAGSYFGSFITYTNAGGIKLRGDKTYLLKFENFSDPVLLESEADLSNRTGPNSDIEINPVGNGGVTVTNVDLQNGMQLKVWGAKRLTVNGALSQSGAGQATMAVLGGATVVLNGPNTLGGGLLINSGLVIATNRATSLGAGSVSLGGGNLTIGAAGAQSALALSGWTSDMIAEKTAVSPFAGLNASVGGWAFYEKGAPNSTQGLPSNGMITSAVNPSVVFQLQPYTSNNVVINSGRVMLNSPASFGAVQLLLEGQGGGGVTYNVSLGFSDGSTTTVSALAMPDWTVNGSNAMTLVGLVSPTNLMWAGFYTAQLNLFQQDITLNAADRRKTLVSVGLQNTANNAMLLAVSGAQVSPYLNNLAVVSNGTVSVVTAGGAVLWNLSIGANTLTLGSGALTLGAATLSGGATFDVASGGLLTFSNAVGGSFAVTKVGAGTLAFGGASSFSGDLMIGGGTARLIASNVLPDGGGAGNVTAGGVFDVGGVNETINGLNGTGAVDNTTSATLTNVLTVGGNDANGNFTGVTRNNSGNLALAKIGTGTQVLAGGNGHGGGTTVSAGLLQLAANTPPAMTVTNPRIWLDAADVFTNGTMPAHGAAISNWLNKGTLGVLGAFTNASRTTVATLADNATFIATNIWFRNRPAVHFEATTDGSSDWQALMNNVNFAGTNVTIFFVGRLSGTANLRMVGAMGNNWLMGAHGGSRGDLYLNNWVYDPAGNEDQATYVYTAMKNGFVGWAWENGALKGTAASGNTQGPNQFRLGGGYINNNTEYSSSDISEVLLFDRALTDAERISVETYLMQKYLQPIPAVGGLNVVSGGTVDMNGQSLNLDSLTGDGLITNSGAAAQLTISRTAVSNSFSGQLAGPIAFLKQGTWLQTFGGSLPNSHSGTNLILQGAMYLTKPAGSAMPGDLTFDNNLSPDVYTIYDNQLSSNTVVSFITDVGDHGRFDLQGTTQTVAGIRTLGYATIRGVVQNRESGPANTATSTLVLAGSGSYAFNGYLRNQTGVLGIQKAGSGTQTLAGGQITYTGPTRVTGGELALSNATAFASAATISGATVRVLNPANYGYGAGVTIAMQNGATLVHTGSVQNSAYITLAGTMSVAGSVTINQDSVPNTSGANKNLFLDGGLTGSGTLTINALNAGNAVIFRNNVGPGFVGTIIVNGIANTVTNQGSGIGVGGCTTNLQNADITVNGTMELLASGIGWAGTASGAFAMGGLSGTGVVIANHTSAGTTLLTLGNTNNPNGSFSGTIANGTGNILSLLKRGGGTQTFSGTNSYTGTTTIQGGTFALTGTAGILSTNIALQSNAVLDVSGIGTLALGGLQTLEVQGTVTGSVTTVAGSRIQPGRLGVVGTASFANNLTLAAGLTNTFELGGRTNIGGGFNDLITVAGTLAANTNRIVINFIAPPAIGTYRLITCGALVGGFDTNLVIQNLGRLSATLDQATPGEINLVIGGAVGDLVWAGTNANWDFVQANWTNTATLLPDTFFNLDRVLFDDTGAAFNTVNITNNVGPGSVTVNAAANYTFNQTGVGKISGVGGITKDGAGILTFNTANENTGALIISNGNVQVGNGGTVGSLGGGTVFLAGGSLTYFRSGNITTATNIFGGGGIVNFVGNGVSGSGSFSPVHLNNGSFSGTINVANARIVPLNPQSLGGAVINVTPGAINGQVYHTAAGTFTNTLQLAGIGWLEGTGNLGALRFQNTSWNGPIVLTANARISPYSGPGTINGTIGGPYELELAGNNTLTLTPSAANTTASTRISGILGAMVVVAGNTNALSTGPLIFSNGTLRLNGNNLSFASLSGVGAGLIKNSHASIPATITVGSDGSDTVFSGELTNGGVGTLGLTKVGAGKLSLTNNNAYTGTTLVNGGTLSLGSGGTLSNSAQIIIVSGATLEVPAAGTFALVGFQSLEGAGLVTGSVTAAASSRVRPGGTGVAGTLSFGNNLTLGAATTNYFEISSDPAAIGGGTNDLVNVGGLLTAGGVLEVSPLTTFSNGTYTLMQCGSLTGAFAGVRNAAGAPQPKNLSLVYTNNTVLLVVDNRAGPVRWNSTNSLAWDQAASFNWHNLSSLATDQALPGDILRFDDTPGVATNVQLTGSLTPSLVSIEAATNTFVFGGSGTLTTLPLLVKSGAGLAIITNNFFNPSLTIISNGTLQIGAGTNTGSLGGSISNSGTLAYFRTDNSSTLTNTISGPGRTIFNGTGVSLQSDYNLTGDNSGLTGPIFVNNARLHDNSFATNDKMLGASTTIINVNTAGQVQAASPTTYNQKLSLNGNGWPETGGPFGSLRLGQGSIWAGEIVLSNNASVGSLASGAVIGAISGPFALSKIASGVVTFSGVSTVSVPRIIVNNGTLWFSKSGGTPAAAAGSIVQMGAANTNQPNLRMGVNNQFGAGVEMVTSNTFNNWTRFDLMGTTQSLAGINDTLGGLVIQNAGSGLAVAGDALLIISNATDNTLLSHIRDVDNINAGGRLAITKNGAGTLLFGTVPGIGPRVSYTGPTTVNQGLLLVTNNTSFNSSLWTIAAGATMEFKLTGVNWSAPSSLTLTGAGTFVKSGNGIFAIGSSATLAANVSFGSGALIDVREGTFRCDWSYNKTNWAANLASLSISNGAKFDTWDLGQSVPAECRIDALNGAGLVDRGIANASNGVLNIGVNNGSGSFTGIISNSAAGARLGLIKSGTGTQTLAGVSTYSGPTTIGNGTLIVNGSIGSGAVTVAPGATLAGIGTIGGTVTSDGLVSPGASPGILTISGGYNQNTGATLTIEIGGINQGSDYDVLNIGGSATLNGTLNISLTNAYVPATNDVFVILTASGTITDTLSVTNLPALGGGNGWLLQNYGNALVLSITSAPPPSFTGYNLAAQSITNPALRGIQDDADGDGYANLLEYVTGGNLTNADNLARMTGTRTNGLLVLKFTRDTNSVDAVLIVEGANSTTNNTGWTGIATNLAGSWGSATNVSEAGGPVLLDVTAYDTAPALNRLLRLRVTRP